MSGAKEYDVSAGAEVLQHLWTDHRVCERLLAAIEQMAPDIEAGDERALRVARGIMARERGYTAQSHYAREELLFERMTARSPQGEAAVKGLSREHDVLARMGVSLLEAIDAKLAGKFDDPDRLRRLVIEYVEAMHNHMGKEQRNVFPLAQQILHAEDWRLVAAAFAEQADPLAPPASASMADVARWLAENGEDPFER